MIVLTALQVTDNPTGKILSQGWRVKNGLTSFLKDFNILTLDEFELLVYWQLHAQGWALAEKGSPLALLQG